MMDPVFDSTFWKEIYDRRGPDITGSTGGRTTADESPDTGTPDQGLLVEILRDTH